jgi:hypothetical protein
LSFLRALPTVACLTLAACASGGAHPEDAFVAPGKYVLYDCPQLATAEAKFAARDAELTRLMARARSGAGGDLVAATVYEPDYYSNLGELKDVRREQAEKKCAANPRGAAAAPVGR